LSKTVLTYSALSTFRNCRRKYFHRYVKSLRRKGMGARALFYGSIIHNALEMHYQGKSMEEILDYIYTVCKEDDTWIHATAMMLGYMETYREEPWEVVSLEEEFQVPIINPETGHQSTTYELRGKVDGLVRHPDGSYSLLEHKTTSFDMGTFVQTLWTDFQTRLYQERYGAFKDIEIKSVIFNILRKNNKRRYKRDGGETDEQFLSRLRECHSGPEMYHREELYFDPVLTAEIGEQVWDLKDNIQLCARKDRWYKNESTCRQYGRMCDYYALCSSADSPFVLDDLYETKRAHSELSMPF